MSANNYGLPQPLTAQAIFDKAALHLLRQGKPSVEKPGDSFCKYRGYAGMACAVGCLIPDDRYVPEMENITPAGIVGLPDFTKSNRLDEKHWIKELEPFVPLLDVLQSVHDQASFCDKEQFDICRSLKECAAEFKLSDAVLETDEARAAVWVVPQPVEASHV